MTDGKSRGVGNRLDPRESILAGARYLNLLKEQLDAPEPDRTWLALAGYNAGWSQVVRYDGIPPFRETEAYVDRIRDREGDYRFRG